MMKKLFALCLLAVLAVPAVFAYHRSYGLRDSSHYERVRDSSWLNEQESEYASNND